MPQFLVQVAYTSEAWAALIKNPQDRVQVVRAAVENLGGKVEQSWMTFGDYDVMVVVAMPDNISAAAFSIAVSGGGSCKAIKTTPLLSVEEGVQAMRKAAGSGYRAVGNA
jgi:uncharacterized protein with GYD domain